MTFLSDMDLIKWANDYRKYIQFQIEVLPQAYQYGGMKFHANDFPTFKDFKQNLGTCRDYTSQTIAHDYDYRRVAVPHNCIGKPFRWDLFLFRETYATFRGVKFNVTIDKK